MNQPRLRRSVSKWLTLWAMSVMWISGNVSCSSLRGADLAHETGRIRTNRLRETSGLAASRQNPDVLWLHNDGDGKEVFAVGIDGRLRARVRVAARLVDVEDIAIGRGANEDSDYVYLGDIGDNEEDRREVRVIRFEEPNLSAASDDLELVAGGVESYRLRYPDGPCDTETLMVDPLTGDLYIATKEERASRVYRASAGDLRQNRVVELELAAHLKVGEVSGGDISRSGDAIVLRSEDRGWLWARRAGESVESALGRPPRRILVRSNRQSDNGESIGFRADGRGYYTVSEGQHEPIFFFPIAPAEADSKR